MDPTSEDRVKQEEARLWLQRAQGPDGGEPPNTGLEAEALLAATGLLHRPDRTAMTAARILVRELTRDLLAVLDEEEPAKLGANKQTSAYHRKLAATPPYEAVARQLELTHGLAFAGAYQVAHQNARQVLQGRYPANNLDGIFGTQILEPDHERLAQWLLEVDVVENQRVVADLAAAAVLPETMEVFATCYPLIYGELRRALDDRLAELARKQWDPPPWLESSLRTFMRMPLEPVPAAPPPKELPPRRVKLAAEELETAADRNAAGS